MVLFEFDADVYLQYVKMIDTDDETVDINLINEAGVVVYQTTASDYCDNSNEVIDLSVYQDAVRSMRLDFSSSGAIAELDWQENTVSTDNLRWDSLKSLYR